MYLYPCMFIRALGFNGNVMPIQQNTSPNSQRGFTVIELSIVLVVSSLLLIPLMKLAFTAIGGNRDQQTEAAFEKAVDALIAYADGKNGCLPFAADSEGGLPDTDLAGNVLTDTGIGVVDQHAGDLPWAELGLLEDTRGGFFRDGDFLRIQYYVATPYADAGINCSAGFRGQEWNPQVPYAVGLYVYDTVDPSDPRLFEITGPLPLAAGTHPDKGAPATDVTAALPSELLVIKRGPDITGAANNQKDEISLQNVFVLIAVGENRNASLDRSYMRDASHAGKGNGDPWPLGLTDVDGVVFSMTHDVSGADRQDDGDDTLRVMSFIEYKSRLAALGKIMQPICDTAC